LSPLTTDGPPEVLAPAELSLPMAGADLSAAAVRSLDRNGIGIDGIEIRTPTLDDVFFTLTGRHVEHEEEEVAA
jgi:hypothetical protein